MLGKFEERNAFHRAVKAAASSEVVFPGAIYDAHAVHALRYHARAYLHGHSVGGTNLSLVEALWASNAVIAHNNAFNRWTAGRHQFFFQDVATCDDIMSRILKDDRAVLLARIAARNRAATTFSWHTVLKTYEDKFLSVIEGDLPVPSVADVPSLQPQADLATRPLRTSRG